MTLSAQDRKVDRYPLQTCSGSAVAIETDPNFMLDESEVVEVAGCDPAITDASSVVQTNFTVSRSYQSSELLCVHPS